MKESVEFSGIFYLWKWKLKLKLIIPQTYVKVAKGLGFKGLGFSVLLGYSISSIYRKKVNGWFFIVLLEIFEVLSVLVFLMF
jgi:hypothetical protein